ncbi:putative disease resistance protein RGA3 [Cannabis sativa]|uniref:putative disease resistance protein RGA3 n=1 Tax=Cannabis sativa TaxID=3483 RepID=UPI0029CA4B7E|nr:putative disease resistance protein RGA3 [Cannabis sativa]
MANLMVGGALLSSFTNVLFDRLATKEVINFFRGNELSQKLLKELKTMLLSANVLLNDAEEKQLRDNNVRNWLDALKEVMYEADHVMDKINTETLRFRVEKDDLKRTLSNLFHNQVKSNIEDILKTLEDLLKQSEHLGLKKVDHKTTLHRPHAPLLDDYQVYGREDDKQAILKLLLCDHDDVIERISVIPIVGMGGIGKSTLAQNVYYDANVQKHFDLKVWVTISDDFDVLKITKLILERIVGKKCEMNELHQIQKDLKDALAGKKFLFVHDNVWNENYELWDLLKSSFQSGVEGSKIIVTTRNEDVALKMKTRDVQTYYKLKNMTDDECWKIFAEHAFDHVDTDAVVFLELQEIGRQIVKKCKGLPLAVKSMAGLLRSMSTPDEWRHVLHSDVWELPNSHNIEIIPSLWLSYRFLPPYLKPCFSYLSIFPKDYNFGDDDREKLILIWMAEGLLQPQKGKRIEDVGEDYLNALIARSFFQRNTRDLSLSMHDLMHDLAMYVSSQCCFIYDSCKVLHKPSSKTRHLSYMKDLENTTEFDDENDFYSNLRSYLALPLSKIFSPTKTRLTDEIMLLKDGGCLRALSLSESHTTELPDKIGNLKHLRYLDVSDTPIKELPASICVLYNLETLLLNMCHKLTQLPTNISKLINLRHLMMRGASLKEMPPRICDMINLQTLSDFVLSENDGSRIKELGKLENLRGSLQISGLVHVKEASDVLEGNLKNKKNLTELILRWNGEADDSVKEREVLIALQPHENLKKLKIEGYRSTNLPDWVTHPSYSNLEEVDLDCKNCCLSLLSFQQLVSLRYLHIFCMEFRGVYLNKPFSFLTSLELLGITTLDWSVANTDDQMCVIFPALKEFHLIKCGKINVALPEGNFPSLEEIEIDGCYELVTIFPSSSTQMDIAYPSLEVLEISFCPRLESFSEMELLPFTLKRLRISSCNMLMENRVKWNLQRLPLLIELSLCGYEGEVDSFPEEWLLPPTLTHLVISDFDKLTALNSKGFHHLTSLQRLHLYYLSKLECLPEGGLPQTLTTLRIEHCPLLSHKCKERIGEDWPKIQYIPIIYIH